MGTRFYLKNTFQELSAIYHNFTNCISGHKKGNYVLVINTVIRRVKNHVHSKHRESPQGVR